MAGELVASKRGAEKRSFPYVTVAVGQLLQAIQIDASTRGLVPAYTNDFWERDQHFFALGVDGKRVPLQLSAFELLVPEIETLSGRVRVDHCIELTMDRKSRLIGGPILTEREEVLAVSIAQSQTTGASFVYARPWSMLETSLLWAAIRAQGNRKGNTCIPFLLHSLRTVTT